ncbi:MAG TPA: PEGA domain-containing protein [Methanospirillum sp.]|nr:PEGA domain-containing protein [Methanospirillum sp.]
MPELMRATLLALVLFLVCSALVPVQAEDQTSSIQVGYYKAELVNATIPEFLESGAEYPVTVTVMNNGMVSWQYGIEKFGLLYQGLQSSISVEPEFSIIPKEYEIQKGQTYTFNLKLIPPEKPGRYDLSFSMATRKGEAQYLTFPESFSRNVEVIPKDGISSGTFGSLMITSVPVGATVEIGGDPRGITPLTLSDLNPATYEITISHPEYSFKTTRVTVEAGSKSLVHLDLTTGGKAEVSTAKSERYTLLGFLLANIPLVILTVAVFFLGLQMLMMDTTRFPENHPVRRYARPFTIFPITFDGKRQRARDTKDGSRPSDSTGKEGGSTGVEKRADASVGKMKGNAGFKRQNLTEKKSTNDSDTSKKGILTDEEQKDLKVDDVDQEGQDRDNPFGFPDGLRDRYEALGVSGDDAYARVYKVLKKENGSIRALKVSTTKGAGSEILQKEATVWGNLRHPNVVRLYVAEFSDELSFLDLEYLDGIHYKGNEVTSLSGLPKPIREKYAVALIRDIAAGLRYTHKLGIRHYHIQPGDILLTSKMGAKISGYARGKNEMGFAVPHSDTLKAIEAYIAPEQKDEKRYGTVGMKTDIFQLGVIFYELLTGYLPYSKEAAMKAGFSGEETSDEIRLIPPSTIRPDLHKYDAIIGKMIDYEKKNRYASVDEFLAALDQVS